MANYRDKHSGQKYSQSQIERKLLKAKKEFKENFILEHDFLHCIICKRSNQVFDVSHRKSINWCKQNGEIELIFDTDNFDLLCRSCHQQRDLLYIGKIDTSFMP